MTAVIAEYKIFPLQLPCKCECGKLLSHAGMHGAVQLSFPEQGKEFLLHCADGKRLLNQFMTELFYRHVAV
jgi:hypothetical protein